MKNNKNKIRQQDRDNNYYSEYILWQIRLPMTSNPWPELPLAEWIDTFETLAYVDPGGRQNPARASRRSKIIGGTLLCMSHHAD